MRKLTQLLFERQAESGMIFLRGHLAVEQAMTTIVDLHGALFRERLDRATFNKKLDLCEKTGRLTTDLVEAIRLVNQERNRLAHRLDVLVTDKRLFALVNSLPPQIRDTVNDVVASGADQRAAEAERWKARLREQRDAEDDLSTFTTTREAVPSDTIQAIFFVLLMPLGAVVQHLRYEIECHQILKKAAHEYLDDEALRAAATPESFRAHLKLPEPPDPRRALGALFKPGADQ